eukprot:6134261-Amphidinium_carterae.1
MEGEEKDEGAGEPPLWEGDLSDSLNDSTGTNTTEPWEFEGIDVPFDPNATENLTDNASDGQLEEDPARGWPVNSEENSTGDDNDENNHSTSSGDETMDFTDLNTTDEAGERSSSGTDS